MRPVGFQEDQTPVPIKMRLPYALTVSLKQEAIGRNTTIGAIVAEALLSRIAFHDRSRNAKK